MASNSGEITSLRTLYSINSSTANMTHVFEYSGFHLQEQLIEWTRTQDPWLLVTLNNKSKKQMKCTNFFNYCFCYLYQYTFTAIFNDRYSVFYMTKVYISHCGCYIKSTHSLYSIVDLLKLLLLFKVSMMIWPRLFSCL